MTNRYWLLLTVVLSILALDQASKYLAVSRLTHTLDGREGLERVQSFTTMGEAAGPFSSYQVIDGLWRFEYAENSGAAWGFWSSLPQRLRQPFYVLFALVALGFMSFMFSRLAEPQRLMQVSVALVLGGAGGNLVDRVLRGFVIDFVDWHWQDEPGLRWPTFNVADASITSGFALMVLASLLGRAGSPLFGSSSPEAPGMPLPAPSSPGNPNS
jgi:signal peptidase II